MVQLIVSQIIDLLHHTQFIHCCNFCLGNTVIHPIILKYQPMASISDQRNFSADRSIFIIIVHKIDIITVISKDDIQAGIRKRNLAAYICLTCCLLQLYLFFSCKTSHFVFAGSSGYGSVFCFRRKGDRIFHIRNETYDLKFMFCGISLFLIDFSSKICNFAIGHRNNIGDRNRFFCCKIDIKRQRICSKRILFQQHFLCCIRS